MKSGSAIPATVDEYMSQITDGRFRALLEKIRAAIRSAAPDAEEVISYQMPAYRQNGILVYFAAFKNHCSFFPASMGVLKEYADELAPFKTSKGTLQFTAEKPLPLTLVKKIVKKRVKENMDNAAMKKAVARK